MRAARLRAALLAGVLIAAGAALALTRSPHELPHREKPTLLLLTSLPLVFGEEFSLEGGSPAYEALQRRYLVRPISVTEPAELAKGRLLLMAQPLAQPAEDLVALDAWVRQGGRLLLFADPVLEWPSSRPLGDPLRPPPMFMDTGLLAHWGLRLEGPVTRGIEQRRLGGTEVVTASPGSLKGGCAIAADGLVARCRLGRGRATIVADADLLDAKELGSAAAHNLDAVLAELAFLAGN
jgi:hypothetical protein